MTLAVKHPRQPAVAVGRPLSGQLPQGVSNRLVLGQPGLMVEGAAMHVEGLTEESDRIFILELVDHLPFLVEAASSSVEAFFTTIRQSARNQRKVERPSEACLPAFGRG